MKLTKWFRAGKNPTMAGCYETKSEGSPCFQYWDGVAWHYCADSPKKASNAGRGFISKYQNPEWRGLAEDPSGGKQ